MSVFGDAIVYVTVFFGILTSLFFLFIYIENEPKRAPKLKKMEKVCIVIPCFNEERTVAKTIESLLALDYPKTKLEIMVVDDGSTDNTYTIAAAYRDRGVKVFRKKNGGKFTALNFAIVCTDAVYLGALDADSIVDTHALKRMLSYFYNERIVAVTPSMKVYDPSNWLQKVQFIEYMLGIFLRKVFSFIGSIHVTPGPFSIYRREFFIKHGLYRHAHNTEDIEVALRIQTLNYEIENCADAYVYTVGPKSWRGLWNQRVRWYSGFIRNIEDYRHLISPRHGVLGAVVIPSAFISILLVFGGVIYFAMSTITQLTNQYVYLRAGGYDFFSGWNWSFDTFFINVNSIAALGAIAFIVSAIIILTAKREAKENNSIIIPYVWFILTYWALYAVWWAAAIWARLRKEKVSWRHKSETASERQTTL